MGSVWERRWLRFLYVVAKAPSERTWTTDRLEYNKSNDSLYMIAR